MSCFRDSELGYENYEGGLAELDDGDWSEVLAEHSDVAAAVVEVENWTSKAKGQDESPVASTQTNYHFHSILWAEEG